MDGVEFNDFGVRFRYPAGWEAEVSEDCPRATVALQSSSGPAFVLVTLDDEGPPPAELADEALAAMREEYPTLEDVPALETIDGHPAIGHDLEFISLDVPNTCAIRCFRTPRRTVLIFAQWSDIEGEDPELQIRSLIRSLEETDA